MAGSLVVAGLGASHGTRVLFSGLDLVVAPGDRVGLVGVNGAGKSTLLQILAGLRDADAGSVTLNPSDASVGYLPQEITERTERTERTGRAGETVAEFLARRTGVAAAQAAMEAAAADLAGGRPGVEDTYSMALERWLNLGGADLEDRAAGVAADVGLGVDLASAMDTLSGGQAARAGLVSLLLSRFDVVLLDEPTNDLDLAGLARLEGFVSGLRAGAVIVSHDREFLARTATRIVELDLAQQKIRQVDGGYRAYLSEREVERQHERQAYDEYAERVQTLGERAHMQRAWMEKGVANARRKAPDHDKLGRKFRSEATEKQAAKARQTQRLIERLDEVAEPRKEWQLKLEIAAAPRSGSVAASAERAVVRRGEFTLGPVNVQIGWADRVAITGPNGAGKTTLLALLLGRLTPEEGSAGLGSGVLVGEVDQARTLLAGSSTLARAMGEALPELEDAAVRTLLAKFGLRGDHVNRPATSLSPGERTRAALALLQGRGVNLLVLDEPTNHLDLAAIEQLESALESFTATILLVTHDRQMLSTVRMTRRWLVEAGQVTELL
jgi:ATPase subunit of ABC transporter with duplicated ATPase domains